jgi:putative transposase
MKKLGEAGELPPTVRNPRAFLIDFLPVLRTLQRNGITVDHITYYGSALKPGCAEPSRRTSADQRTHQPDLRRCRHV